MSRSTRLIAIFTVLVIVLVAVSSPALGANRRITGIGGTLSFRKGEAVAGEVIGLQGGKHFYRCKHLGAPRRGKVTSGVINPVRAEVKHLKPCGKTLASPGPRRPTGEGRWRNFRRGDHVLGFAIEVETGFSGRTYFDCVVVDADARGRVLSGVVNPSRFEIQAMQRRCNRTNDWRPGFRMETGSGSLRFLPGDYVMGAFMRLDNGQEMGPCHTVAPTSGTLYGGVINFWPGESSGLSHC